MNLNSWLIFLLCSLCFSQVLGCKSCTSGQCSNCCSSCQRQCSDVHSKNCQRQQSGCTPCTDENVDCSQNNCPTNKPKPDEPIREPPNEDKNDEHHESHNSNSLIANVSSQNTINNHNVINLTIAVNSNVVNNIINNVSGSCEAGGGDTSKCENNTEIVTVTVPVPVKVPVCAPNCTAAAPPPPPLNGCCVIVTPCVTQNCYPYRYQCHGCRGSYGYQPINPCQRGCARRDTWDRQSCSLGHCMSRTVDCSYCNEDFYRTYEGYSRCRGCFHGH